MLSSTAQKPFFRTPPFSPPPSWPSWSSPLAILAGAFTPTVKLCRRLPRSTSPRRPTPRASVQYPIPTIPSEPFYPTEAARAEDAVQKFSAVAEKYPNTNPGRLAAYYAALCYEDLERHNQALEQLKKISSGKDKELVAMAQYQTGVIYERTGKTADAVKVFRDLADHSSVFVPRPLVLLELAETLRQSDPKEAASVYEQLKKEFPEYAHLGRSGPRTGNARAKVLSPGSAPRQTQGGPSNRSKKFEDT